MSHVRIKGNVVVYGVSKSAKKVRRSNFYTSITNVVGLSVALFVLSGNGRFISKEDFVLTTASRGFAANVEKEEGDDGTLLCYSCVHKDSKKGGLDMEIFLTPMFLSLTLTVVLGL